MVTGITDNEKKLARLTPPEAGFNAYAFQHWYDKNHGKEYLQLDPYKKEGLVKILRFCKIKVPSGFWEQKEPIQLYVEVLKLVQNNGRYCDWTISAEEGMHRLTASVIRTLALKLDVQGGTISPGTIDEEYLDKNGVKRNGGDRLTPPDFREKLYCTTFKSEEPRGLINAKVFVFTAGGLNGCEASYHLRTRSYLTSLNKLRSATRCPFDLMGELLGTYMGSISWDQATRRVYFDEEITTNPTHRKKEKTVDYVKDMHENGNDFEKAYPISTILASPGYQEYVKDPLGEGMMDKAIKLFGFKPIKDFYHVPKEPANDAYKEIEQKLQDDNALIYPPFLPSYASNAIDVGNQFAEKSRFHPDSVNAAILAPPVFAYIMSAFGKEPMPEVILKDSRVKLVMYYLRFHNSLGDCSTMKRVHSALVNHYNMVNDSSTCNYLCAKSTAMLGMLDFVLTSFNSYLSIEAEKMITSKWKERKEHFQQMGNQFRSVFSNIGNTKQGRDYKSVVHILGMSLLR